MTENKAHGYNTRS